MSVLELIPEQLEELKQSMLFERLDARGECPSYGEIANVGETISNEEVFAHYAGYAFNNDDFFCTAGMEA